MVLLLIYIFCSCCIVLLTQYLHYIYSTVIVPSKHPVPDMFSSSSIVPFRNMKLDLVTLSIY